MENVHILTQRVSARGEFLPFSAEHYRINETNNPHDLIAKLQTTLSIENILTIFANHAKQLINLSGLQFQSSLGVSQSAGSDTSQTPYSFDLDIESERLGQLIYFSQFPMGKGIEAKLEQLHSALVYPLRNAIMYNRVLRLATKDALTGLNNRSQFNDSLAQKLERCRRQNRPFSLMLLDLDNFKQVNDSFGHKIGDDVLQEFSEVLCSSVRGTDSIFRFGGDEFVLLLPDLDDPHHAQEVAERLLLELAQPYRIDRHELYLSASIVIALSDEALENPAALLQQADMAMYKAKQQGRNTLQTFTYDINQKLTQRVTLRNDLQEAITQEQFELHYQPLLTRDGDIHGFEALVRWNHPVKGPISPGLFIPIAEETGQIIGLSQ